MGDVGKGNPYTPHGHHVARHRAPRGARAGDAVNTSGGDDRAASEAANMIESGGGERAVSETANRIENGVDHNHATVNVIESADGGACGDADDAGRRAGRRAGLLPRRRRDGRAHDARTSVVICAGWSAAASAPALWVGTL